MVGTLFLMIFFLHNSWTNWNCTCLQQSNMYLSISWIFLQFWFRCIFYPPPPTHPLAKQWKKIFSWIYPFHAISCNFGLGVFLPPPPPGQTVNKFFVMDLSISWNFLLMMTVACRYVGIRDQLVWWGFQQQRRYISLVLIKYLFKFALVQSCFNFIPPQTLCLWTKGPKMLRVYHLCLAWWDQSGLRLCISKSNKNPIKSSRVKVKFVVVKARACNF